MPAPPDHRPPDAPDPQLSALLQAWRVPAEAPARLADNVWAQLAVRGRTSARATPAQTLLLWLTRPFGAVAFFAAVLVVAAGAGTLHGKATSNAYASALQSRYIQSIDPFAAQTLSR